MEEDFEFLDENPRTQTPSYSSSPRSAATVPRTPSPTDFELVDAQRVRNLDDNDINVQDDYFVADNKPTGAEERQSTASEDSLSEDDFIPVRRSKRNKKPKTKAKKGLQALSDVKCKIPPKVKNRTSSGSIPKNIVKNKPLYSQILQGVATEKEIDIMRKSMLEESITETKGAVCEEAAAIMHVLETRTEPEVRSECEPEDSEIEVMQCSTTPEETVDELIARVSREQEEDSKGRLGTSVKISSPVDEQVVFSTVDTAEDVNAWKFSSIFGISSQIFDRDYFKPRKTEEQKQQQKAHYDNIKKLEQEQKQLLQQQQQQQQEEEKKEEEEEDDEVEVVEMGEEAEEEDEVEEDDAEEQKKTPDEVEESEEESKEEGENNQDDEEEEDEEEEEEEEEDEEEEDEVKEQSNMVMDSRFTKSVDDYGLKALFEERLLGDDCNSLIAMKTSTLMLAVLCSVVFGVLFGNCLVSIFMPATYSGISVHTPTAPLTVEDDKFIMVKVDPAPPLFNYSSIWFGQPNEENLRSIFNEFRRLQRDHLRLQDAYNELRENMHLEKQMKWYWRKQARKDVVSLNSVKYTLHDGLMKVSEPKPPTPVENVAEKCDDKPTTYDSTITNLTESLKNAQQASNYWRGMYNDRMSGMVNASKDCLHTVSFNQRIRIISKTLNNLKTSPQTFNLSMDERNSVEQVRGAWTRLKRQWREKKAASAAKEAARLNVNRFRKMFSMVKMTPKNEKKETTEQTVVNQQQQQTKFNENSEDVEVVSTNSSDCDDQAKQASDDSTGEFISVCIQQYGSRTSNESTSCFNPYPVPYDVAKDERKQLKWFKNKYEELLLLSEITKWRTKYEMKKALERGEQQVAEVSRKKDKEVQELQVSAQSSSFKWVFLTKLILARLHYPIMNMLGA